MGSNHPQLCGGANLQRVVLIYVVNTCSDSFTVLGLWVLGLAVSLINESNCKLMSPEHYFNDKSAILLHPGTR